MTKDIQLNIRLSKEDKKLLKKDADEEDRSISSLLLRTWKKWRKSKRR